MKPRPLRIGIAHHVEVVFVNARREHVRLVLADRELKALRRDALRADRVVRHRHRCRQRHLRDALHLARLVSHLLEELLGLRLGVAHERRIEAHDEQVIGAVARSAGELLAEAAVHEQRDGEQHHRRGHLRDDENRASPAAPASRRDDVAGLDDGGEVRARRLNRRHQPEDDGAHHRDDEAEDERAAISSKVSAIGRSVGSSICRNRTLPA